MRFSHVIFDMDGTLLNTLDDLALAANLVCAAHGWPEHSLAEYKHMVGNGVEKLVERYMPEGLAAADPALFEQTVTEQRATYAAHRRDHTEPYPGITAMLDELRAHGTVLAVLSNKDHSAVEPLAREYFGNRFAAAQGREERFAPKPDPVITRALLKRLDADPSCVLYVGDSDVDVATGHNVGMPVCGVAWGFRGRAELEAAGTDYLANEPADIVRIATGQ